MPEAGLLAAAALLGATIVMAAKHGEFINITKRSGKERKIKKMEIKDGEYRKGDNVAEIC